MFQCVTKLRIKAKPSRVEHDMLPHSRLHALRPLKKILSEAQAASTNEVPAQHIKKTLRLSSAGTDDSINIDTENIEHTESQHQLCGTKLYHSVIHGQVMWSSD